ncbi:MAG: deoxyribodipyrimidine photo-lyase [Bdellovibrionaceae bacterium]|nr:deoxyribodipyrimidine photo-lyase [Pseudobdellovibrionaceae bacterium]
MKEWGIHWFRRDLRVADNAALKENWRRTHRRTLGLFCFDSKFLSRSDFSHNRFAFFLKTLNQLRQDWRKSGGDLLIVDSAPQEAFAQLLEYCQKKNIPTPALVSWNRDYEPYARERDVKIEKFLQARGIVVYHARDHLVFEPHEVVKDDGKFYQVYSPFSRKWFSLLDSEQGRQRLMAQSRAAEYFNRDARDPDLFQAQWSEMAHDVDFPFRDAWENFEKRNCPHVTIPVPEAGFHVAFRTLQKFTENISGYKENRDIPSLEGTSQLSKFFKNGSLTVLQVLAQLDTRYLHWHRDDSQTKFIKELVWREFYYSILYHQPRIESEAFLTQFKNIRWENNHAFFEHWKQGTTGFPIVDAGMRQLLMTGWMHNRVRMIVASFLTKDLLIDWRWGENHFMKELLDGDLAPNNGGWQWAASTGCDPQPYFRIFNPWLQGKKFDPEGKYIRMYVPELQDAPSKLLHDPEGDRRAYKYPLPIVNHSVQRDKALKLYTV